MCFPPPQGRREPSRCRLWTRAPTRTDSNPKLMVHTSCVDERPPRQEAVCVCSGAGAEVDWSKPLLPPGPHGSPRRVTVRNVCQYV